MSNSELPAQTPGDLQAFSDRSLVAYRLSEQTSLRLQPAPWQRSWMDRTAGRFAYRCLPLVVANQWGWWIITQERVTAIWDGGDELSALKVGPVTSQKSNPACSHFGHGILTWRLPWLFRTPSGFNLLLRGPSNAPKDAICPLEGIVETDWVASTATMNWQITRPDTPIVFEKDEPVAMLVPQRRHELESFSPLERDLRTNPELAQHNAAWSASRADFLRDLKSPGSTAAEQGWQKDYTQGIAPDGSKAPDHQTRLNLEPFKTEP